MHNSAPLLEAANDPVAFLPTSRRRFLQASLAAGALFVRWNPALAQAAGASWQPSPWLRLDGDGRVTLAIGKSEMGQGVMTTLAMLVAEELEVDYERITVVHGGVDPAFKDPIIQEQTTYGSFTTQAFWKRLRELGASTRELLIRAAARQWGVEPATCAASKGQVIHSASGRRIGYAALLEAAAKLPSTPPPPLKPAKDFRVIGQSPGRKDSPDKVMGRAIYGLDVSLPGLMTAQIIHPPVFGGKLASLEATKALALPGVHGIYELTHGVAIVARSFWAVQQARALLDIRWDDGPRAAFDSKALAEEQAALARGRGVTNARASRGDVDAAFAGAKKILEAEYSVPYLAHACMEPLNCTARVSASEAEIWVGTQSPEKTRLAAAGALGLAPERVTVHTMLMGGGFGRRYMQDVVVEAVSIASAAGVPVKLVYTREDDLKSGFYRPQVNTHMKAALAADGAVLAVHTNTVGASVSARFNPKLLDERGLDGLATSGLGPRPYTIANWRVEAMRHETEVPVTIWRSVGFSQNLFARECFIDELADAAGRDPLAFRRALLGDFPRAREVLEQAVTRSRWDEPLAKGRGRGIALLDFGQSTYCLIAEVSTTADAFKVERLTFAMDCGLAIHPGIVRQQMEGGLVWGLSSTLFGEITFKEGRVQQSNFHDYRLLRLAEMPAIETILIPSMASPAGMGEYSGPPLVGPAVANAIFSACGKRLRSLPLRFDRA